MAMRGQRFAVDTDCDFSGSHESALTAGFGLVSDIKERSIASDGRLPSPPRLKSDCTGFPAHKSRQGARFKRTRQDQAAPSRMPEAFSAQAKTIDHTSIGKGICSDGRSTDDSIDAENRQRLAEMSEEEILQARQDLMSGLNPSLIEKLLKKANIEEDFTEPACPTGSSDDLSRQLSVAKAYQKVTSEDTDVAHPPTAAIPQSDLLSQSDLPPLQPPSDLHAVSSKQPLPPITEIHFPKRPPAPELDPSDPDFLTKLRATYFPSLPADPSSLGWMAPVNAEEQASYSPSQDSLPPSSLRFDFRGRLLPPRLSSQIPSTKGLHHHGHAPESAGYTIPELAHLARSAVTSQRCIAYQTLGRILYRLGRGDFGAEGEELWEGLWGLMEKGKVLQGMIEAASKENEGSRSVWATAIDAIWLWRKGGGKRWKGR